VTDASREFGLVVCRQFARLAARVGVIDECCKHKRKAVSLAKLRAMSDAKPSRV
jgi:hypothetical protein